MTVGFVVVVSIVWSAQRSHDLLGFRRPTTVAALLLATERARRASDASFIHPEFHYRRQLLLY